MSNEEFPEGAEARPPGVRAMAVVRWLLVLFMALAAVYALGSTRGWFRHSAVAARVLRCPMHPSVVQDQPGDCPICGMTLVEDSALQAATPSFVPGLATVELSAERIQLTGMKTAQVIRGTLATELRVVGAVVASEKGLASIETRFAGWIESLSVEQTGQHVAKGQVVAAVYSPEILAAEEEFLNAVRWSGSNAEALPAAMKTDARSRLELLGVGSEEIDTIERIGKPMRAVPIRSAVDGHVTQKNVVRGAHVEVGAALFQVANLETVWFVADVTERDVSRVRIGHEARVELASFPGETFSGRVTFLAPTLDAITRTLRVRVELRNPRFRLKPGMFGSAALQTDGTTALVIPVEALIDTGDEQYVFVARAGGQFEPRPVQIGARALGMVQVLSGVSEGEGVVTTANFLLDSESRVRAGLQQKPLESQDRCRSEFDDARLPDKFQQCRACAQHRGMGAMEDDCIDAIPKPWR